MDEPEVGLHPHRIYELIEVINSNVKNTLLLLNTHSPNIIVNLVELGTKFELYRFYNINLHTEILKLNKDLLIRNTHRITIKEASCYFSDALVFVEGETELQLFKQKKILELFPALKQVTFYSFDSSDPKLRNVHPAGLNLGIPYLVILDMDKIINFEPVKEKFICKKEYYINPLADKSIDNDDRYVFYKKDARNLRIEFRQEILKKLKGETFKYKESFNYIESATYRKLIISIINYCQYFNLRVNFTTIEGEIVTLENIDKFSQFLVEKFTYDIPDSKRKALTQDGIIYKNIANMDDKKEKLMLTLYSINGKLELMNSPKVEKSIKLKKLLNGKTSGWIDEWINYNYDNFLSCLPDEESVKKQFARDFPSLSITVHMIEKMIKS